MKINLITHFEIIGGEMMRNLGLLVFLLHESWLEQQNEQLWCFVLWKMMDGSWILGKSRGFHGDEDEMSLFDSKNM